VSSLQAILFSRPGALLFGDEAEQEHLVLHLEHCAQLAAAFSAGPVVFGAPRNRLKGHLPDEEAFARAARILRRVAPAFASCGATLCIEANPVAYGCDFAVKASEAAMLVRMVDHPGVRLHLDTACMYLAGDPLDESIYTYADILAHFHVSEPQLGDFSEPVVPHEDAAEALWRIGYRGWITLEMRATTTPLASLFAAAVYLTDTYDESVAKAVSNAC
jgi:sugar phosphate isomerase/epimerase